MKVIGIIVVFFVWMSCSKDIGKKPIYSPEPTPNPKVTFVFVNRFGYKNDSTKHGVNDTVFSGCGIDGKYYDNKSNTTYLSYSAFNRNYFDPQNRLSDSVVFTTGQYTLALQNKYGYQISLKWVNSIFPYATKVYEYTTKNFNGGGDTVKVLKDTVIKFIWPNDSNSNKFIRTLKWP